MNNINIDMPTRFLYIISNGHFPALVMSDISLTDGQVAIRERQHPKVQSNACRSCLGSL